MNTATQEPMDDVWSLESNDEEFAIDDLNQVTYAALNFSGTHERHYLRHLWDGESWKSIKEKLMSEGSTWYVWYMDGVRHHLAHLMPERYSWDTCNSK